MDTGIIIRRICTNTFAESLPKFLSAKVFAGETGTVMGADPKEVAGFDTFIERYKEGFAIERAAVDHLK